MGARLLADWLTSPLTDLDAITRRHGAVAELLADSALPGRSESGSGTGPRPRTARRTVRHVPRLAPRPCLPGKDAGPAPPDQGPARRAGVPAAERAGRIARTLPGDPRGHRAGDRRRPAPCPQGRRPDPRRLPPDARRTARDRPGGQDLDRPLPGRAGPARPGINGLKVGFNKVFGYYIEITHAQAAGRQLPPTTSASRRSRTANATSPPS